MASYSWKKSRTCFKSHSAQIKQGTVVFKSVRQGGDKGQVGLFRPSVGSAIAQICIVKKKKKIRTLRPSAIYTVVKYTSRTSTYEVNGLIRIYNFIKITWIFITVLFPNNRFWSIYECLKKNLINERKIYKILTLLMITSVVYSHTHINRPHK